MPFKDNQTIERRYWTIGQVMAKLGFRATSQLRYYESRRLLKRPPVRNKAGNRCYTSADIDALKKIHQASESDWLTLPGIKVAVYQPQKLLALIYQMHPELAPGDGRGDCTDGMHADSSPKSE